MEMVTGSQGLLRWTVEAVAAVANTVGEIRGSGGPELCIAAGLSPLST